MKGRSVPERAADCFWHQSKNVNILTSGTTDHLIRSLGLKIRVSSFREPHLSDQRLFGSSEMKTTGPTWFVPPGPSQLDEQPGFLHWRDASDKSCTLCSAASPQTGTVDCSISTNVLIRFDYLERSG